MSTRQTIVEIGGVAFTDDVLANVRVDMGARTAWEQNVAGIATVLIQQDDPDVIISDDLRIAVESPDTVEATGGVESTITVNGVDYHVHVFSADGTLTVTIPGDIEYLIVGGGGGGGNGWVGSNTSIDRASGGGGAGGVLTGSTTLTAQTYSITVGQGGAAQTNGGNSSAFGLTAIGGGHGGQNTNDSGGFVVGSGGSGGGSAASFYNALPNTNFGAGTAGQGFPGGSGLNNNVDINKQSGGGGGGASEAGKDGTETVSGAGGDGIASSITGTSVVYGGGGGGGARRSTVGAPGGAGGGGAGGYRTNGTVPGGNGTDGLGGGGGAGGGRAAGGTGGDGIVIIRYAETYQTVFRGRVDNTAAELTDIGPIWTITASGPLTKAGRRELNSIIAADTEGDQIALLAQDALATQWAEAPLTWADQTLTWDGYEVDTSQIDQPGQYALAAIDQLPTNVVEAMTTAAFSGSGWLYETRTGLLGYADSVHRESTPQDDYLVIPGSVTARNQFLTVTREADIANDIIVEYDGGDVTGQATDSMPIYGRWQRTYTTTLADQSAAEAFLTRRLQLEGAPRLNVAGSILIDLKLVSPTLFDQLVTVERNTGVILENVPTYLAPEGIYRGFVEGYIWNLGPIDPTLEMFVSEYSLSNFGLRWAAAGPTQWSEVGVSLTWQDATEALA